MARTYRGTGAAGSVGTQVLSQAELDAAVAAAAASASNAATSESAAEAAENNAEVAQTAAELAETNAETAETGAETAQTAAELAETNAETAETNADASASAAGTAETNAETAETNAETAETNAVAAQGYAEEWATKPEDSLISVAAGGDGSTDYSALHWAAKAGGNSYTKAELDGGQLDNRYYTETEADANFAPKRVNAGTVATTSGTAVTFTGIPSWATKITLAFNEVSSASTDHIIVQLGNAGGIVTSGYIAVGARTTNGSSVHVQSSAAFIIYGASAAQQLSGIMEIQTEDGDEWIEAHSGKQAGTLCVTGGGSCSLTGPVTQVKISGDNVSAFDLGAITLFYA